MHILILPSWYRTPEIPNSGIFFFEQAVALASHGHQVSLVYYENRSIKKISLSKLSQNHFQIVEELNKGVLEFSMKGWNPLAQTKIGRYLWEILLYKTVLKYIAKHGKPDLIHVHSIFWSGNIARKIKQKKNIPYFVTEHSSFWNSPFIFKYRKYSKHILEEANRVFAVSYHLSKRMTSVVNSLKIEIVPNFLDVDFYSSFEGKTMSTDKFVFFSLGNLITGKGFDILLRAFSREFKAKKDIELRIGGIGILELDLKKMACDLGIESQVIFLGLLNKEAVRNEMVNSDAFILLSRGETFGMVYAEAMACGKPVIATRCGGPEDFVTPECGYLVNDENEAVFAMAELIQNRNKFDSNKIKKYANHKFSANKLVLKLEHYYAENLI